MSTCGLTPFTTACRPRSSDVRGPYSSRLPTRFHAQLMMRRDHILLIGPLTLLFPKTHSTCAITVRSPPSTHPCAHGQPRVRAAVRSGEAIRSELAWCLECYCRRLVGFRYHECDQ